MLSIYKYPRGRHSSLKKVTVKEYYLFLIAEINNSKAVRTIVTHTHTNFYAWLSLHTFVMD